MANLEIYKFDHVVSFFNLFHIEHNFTKKQLIIINVGFDYLRCQRMSSSVKEVKTHSGNCSLKFLSFDISTDLLLKSVVVVMRNYLILLLVFFPYYLCLNALGPDEDPYKILGVTRSASQADIKRAYKKMARNW